MVVSKLSVGEVANMIEGMVEVSRTDLGPAMLLHMRCQAGVDRIFISTSEGHCAVIQ